MQDAVNEGNDNVNIVVNGNGNKIFIGKKDSFLSKLLSYLPDICKFLILVVATAMPLVTPHIV